MQIDPLQTYVFIKRRNNMFKTILPRIFLLAVVASSVAAAFPQAASASALEHPGPVRLEFDKQGGAGGVWNGTVTGDAGGSLTTRLLSVEPAGPILKVSFAWIVDAGEQSFTAVLHGTLNTRTGQVEMDGTIVEGWLAGARVHEAGQRVDPLTGRFQGTITIFPMTAD
jgi:hypothetical protein